MTELPKRIGALAAAVLFLAATVGITLVVIWQASQQNKNNAGDQLVDKCVIDNGVEAEILADPQIVKPALPANGVVKEDLEQGNGQEAQPGDCLHVKYYGYLADTGVKFDTNFDKPTTLRFRLGKGDVIPGWDQAIAGIRIGGTRRIVIPPDLAYGSQAVGEIPANATLVFVIKLIKIGDE